jgi:CheY-like chemotaxis protein
MVRQGRILIVDNLPEWREVLVETLQQNGYYADSASSVTDALERLNETFYHIVVADIRMDEVDQSNTDGLGLLGELEKSGLSEATQVIMLTAYGTTDQMREAFTDHGVANFLSKDNFSRQVFLKSVEQVFTRDTKINFALELLFQAGSSAEQAVLDLEVDNTRIKRSTSLQSQMAIELEDLLCRLFYRTNGILVRPLTNGQSGARVLRVQPFYSNKGIGREMVVKFGDVGNIQQEYQNFKDYVEPFIGGGRNTAVQGVRRTTHLGGITYTFLGTSSDQLIDFGEFYRRSSASQITDALDQLFRETCGTWYANHKLQVLDLTADYRGLFEYTPEQLEQIRTKHLKSVRGRQKLRFTALNSERFFTNPLLVIAKSTFACKTYTCTTHGDFNPHNLLVDSEGHIWLIDFQETGPSHILRDVAMLDSAIRFQLLAGGDATLDERLYMEDALLGDIQRFSQVDQLATSISKGNQALEKAYAIIAHLRRLAHQLVAQNQDDDISEYYIALFYTALNTLQFFSLSATQREHALLSASLLADRLGLSSR